MKPQLGLWPVALLAALAGPSVHAQSVEVLFMQSTLPKALEIKAALKSATVSAFAAAGLMNVSPERRKAYIAKISGMKAAVVVGDDAAKAVAGVEFPIPVILVDSTATVTGTKGLLRVLGPAHAARPAGASTVSTAGAAAALAAGLKPGADITARCEGLSAGAAIEQILGALH